MKKIIVTLLLAALVLAAIPAFAGSGRGSAIGAAAVVSAQAAYAAMGQGIASRAYGEDQNGSQRAPAPPGRLSGCPAGRRCRGGGRRLWPRPSAGASVNGFQPVRRFLDQLIVNFRQAII